MSIGAWEPFVADLAKRHRVIRCDFRGQLLSPGPYPETIEEHAADVVALLDHLQVARVHVAGASFGGEVAIAVAARAPERIEKLTIITATERTTDEMRNAAREARELAEQAADGNRQSAERLFLRVLTDTWSEPWLAEQPADFIPSRVRQLVMLPPGYFAGAAKLLGILESLDLTADLARVTAPTLVIGGEGDRIFPAEHSRAIARAIPNARLEILSGTGHGLLIERAKRVVELLER
jgi:3-oxoadipate enol-lactonase